MSARSDLLLHALSSARDMLHANIEHVTFEESLAAAGGYRSIIGLIKHIAGWSHVYHSYAFDPQPRHWEQTAWPRGLREAIDRTPEYLDELRAWLDRSFDAWTSAIRDRSDAELDAARPLHWGKTAPLYETAVLVAEHWTYHAGEINAILAVVRGESWEEGEQVEENHIDSTGHRVTLPWKSGS